MHAPAPKRRGFFLTSFFLSLAAVAGQAVAIYFALLSMCMQISAGAGRMMWMLPPFVLLPHSSALPAPPAPVDPFYKIADTLAIVALLLALFSTFFVIASFRYRETGWRFLPIGLLTIYFGSWLFILTA